MIPAGEVLGVHASKAALQAHRGPTDPMSVYEAARFAVDTLAAREGMDVEDVRRARLVALGRLWQGFGVPGAGPDRYVGRAWWVEQFRALGWAHLWQDGPPPSPLTGGITLYRGATKARCYGLSWTPDSGVAQWFADRAGGRVWRVESPASGRFLLALPIELRGTGLPVTTEYLVDVEGLEVAE